MKIFVTGATGFIGTHVARRLAQTEHEMYCLVRNTSNVRELQELGATLVPGDVTDKDSVLAGMQGCDWVLHLANVLSYWEPNKRIYTDVNVNGTRNVMECALQTGVSKVVHVSSVGIYGKPTDCPFTEESPVGPVRFSEYARTKYEGDLVAWALHKEKRLPLVIVYPCAVLGAGASKVAGDMIKRLIDRKMPARAFDNSIMTYVHVRDVADAIVRAAEKENNIGASYIVGKQQMSARDFCKTVTEISGVPMPRVSLPAPVAMFSARPLTWMSSLTKKPPPWGMSVEGMRTFQEGFRADGSKAERELGISYAPIHVALEEAIESFRRQP